MKKFIASENIAIATSRGFKESIEFACSNTEVGHQHSTSRWDKKFIGTVVTFDNVKNKVVCFDFYGLVDTSNHDDVSKELNVFLGRISSKSEHENLEFVTLIEANQFEYHGYVGYPSKEQQSLSQLQFDNIFMSTYIDIVTDNCKDFSFDNSPTIETLNLSMRTFNCLKRANINTVGQIKALSFDEIVRVRNLGRNSINELQEKLNIEFV